MEFEDKYGKIGQKIVNRHKEELEKHFTRQEAAERARLGFELLKRLLDYKHPAESLDSGRDGFDVRDTFELRPSTISGRRVEGSLAISGNCLIVVSGWEDDAQDLIPRDLRLTMHIRDIDSEMKFQEILGTYTSKECGSDPDRPVTGFNESSLENMAHDSDEYNMIVDALREALEVAGVPIEDLAPASV